MIELMTHAGARPMQILAAIQREDKDTLVSATDIRSERKAIRRQHLDGRSPIETLLDDLSTDQWVFSVQKDECEHVKTLFFAHKKQVELLLSNPDVLLMDCTYRTNKYRCHYSIYLVVQTCKHFSQQVSASLVVRHRQITTGQ
jgi:hypothetical protein